MKQKQITVHLQDAMAARIILERSGINVIFSKSERDTVAFCFFCSEKVSDRAILRLKANGIAPILKPPYTNKTVKISKR